MTFMDNIAPISVINKIAQLISKMIPVENRSGKLLMKSIGVWLGLHSIYKSI